MSRSPVGSNGEGSQTCPSLMEKWAAGNEVLGSWLSIPDPHAAEVVSRVDFDYVCVDMQHGIADYQAAAAMIPARVVG